MTKFLKSTTAEMMTHTHLWDLEGAKYLVCLQIANFQPGKTTLFVSKSLFGDRRPQYLNFWVGLGSILHNFASSELVSPVDDVYLCRIGVTKESVGLHQRFTFPLRLQYGFSAVTL
jgi:hypothetical protein